MNYRERYEAWLQDPSFDADFLEELKSIPEEELEERFYKELSFGTAGLRGINGAGSNRMNKYVIRRASQGYALYLNSISESPSCAIAYDNRRFSRFFAMESASVLAANGIKTYLFPELKPTPELSFTIIDKACTGGIVCTASHNPPEYSGFKVYGSDGCQLNSESAARVAEFILGQNGFSEIQQRDFEEAVQSGLIEWIDEAHDERFINAVKRELLHPETLQVELKSVYTPLNGAGAKVMQKLFASMGLNDVYFTEEQMIPDPNFTTCPVPNPEEEVSFELAKVYGKRHDAEILIATDPDADRIGTLVRNKDGEYVKINGNQIGALLAYYLFSQKKDMPKKPCLVKTVVTSDLTEYIAEDHQIQVRETLTGFKNICGIIREFDKAGEPDFIMGFEESYGYLVGTHCRDKDSFVSAMLLLDMAKFYKSQGKDLFDVLDEIYAKYGYFVDDLISLVKPGKAGMEEINKLMRRFREAFRHELAELGLKQIYDYQRSEILEVKTGERTKIDEEESNVLKFRLDCGSWIAARPSGTEPKVKFYFCIMGRDEDEARSKHKQIKDIVETFIG